MKFLHMLVATLELLLTAPKVSAPSHDLQSPASGMAPTDDIVVGEQILFVLKGEIVRDPTNVLRFWDSNVSSDCNRSHVTCDGHRNRVNQLNPPSLGLEGSLKPMLGSLEFLETIAITSVSFSGGIPSGLFKNSSNLQQVLFGLISFSGSVLNSVDAITELDVGRNSPSRNISMSQISLSILRNLDLSSNKLTGEIPPIPSSPGECKSLSSLDLASNHIQDSIRYSLKECSSLSQINLSNNAVTGPVPPWLSELRNSSTLRFSRTYDDDDDDDFPFLYSSLDSLDLSFNALDGGSIPASLGSVGSVPEFVQENCLNVSCDTSFDGIDIDSDAPDNVPPLVIALLFGLVAAAFAISSVLIWFHWPWVKKPSDLHVQELAARNEPEVIQLTIEDLIAATDNFSSENTIGYGSSGTVYKGVLPVFPFVIAVKKFDDDLQGRQRLEREAKVMKLIRHRNLVRGLGARSSDPGSQLPELNVLVLEYMENGTLDQLLYSDPLPDFSWDMRVDIAVDVATGLCYLHEDAGTHIQLIHGDIKPSNIFLKSGFVVLWFSISLDWRWTEMPVINLLMAVVGTALVGTVPQIGQGYMSTAGDVYSFGVVILEMLVRRRPTSFDVDIPGSSFVQWIRDSFPDNVSQIVGRTLASELERNVEPVTLLFKLGLLCTVDIPWDRPTMKEALAMVKTISSRMRNEPEVTH